MVMIDQCFCLQYLVGVSPFLCIICYREIFVYCICENTVLCAILSDSSLSINKVLHPSNFTGNTQTERMSLVISTHMHAMKVNLSISQYEYTYQQCFLLKAAN